MKTLLIVYHSMTGGTLQMAEAAASGARAEPAVRVSLKRAADAEAADVLNRLHARADRGGNSAGETHCRTATASLRGTRRDIGLRPGVRYILRMRVPSHA